MLADAVLQHHPDRLAAVERAWNGLNSPGPTLTAAERIGVITDARAAWAGAGSHDPGRGLLGEAAHWLAVDAEGISGEFVADLEARGLDRYRYLEVVGVVGRLANIDWYARGLGASLPHVLTPIDTAPTGRVDGEAKITDGWVPALGPLMAPYVLDALPDEGVALRDLHQPMYVPFDHIMDANYFDAISKPQIEYLAARTSYLNECFY